MVFRWGSLVTEEKKLVWNCINGYWQDKKQTKNFKLSHFNTQIFTRLVYFNKNIQNFGVLNPYFVESREGNLQNSPVHYRIFYTAQGRAFVLTLTSLMWVYFLAQQLLLSISGASELNAHNVALFFDTFTDSQLYRPNSGVLHCP